MNAICNLNENEAQTKPTSPFMSYRPVFRTSLKPIKILMCPGSPLSSENQALIGQKGKGNGWPLQTQEEDLVMGIQWVE